MTHLSPATTPFGPVAVAGLLAGVAGAAVALAVGATSRAHTLRRRLTAAEYGATHDPLTGALNRTGFEAAWLTVPGYQRRLGLLDLNGFKAVNDQLGHAAGDAVLRVIAGRLRRQVPITARTGGDEFAIVLGGVRDAVVRGLAADLARPIRIPATGDRVVIGAAIGVACHRELGAALAAADAAMYRSKATGGLVEYDPRRDDRTSPAADPRPAVRLRDMTTPTIPTIESEARA